MQGPTYAPPRPDAILLDFEGERRDIGAYEAAGGYAVARAQAGRPFDEIVQDLKDSGLRGRGGAGFPTGMKVSFIGKGERFLVVNADESEPGTFKDRELMLRNPHALIEGCIILCNAIGAKAAYIYIRGEYATEAEVLDAAIRQAYDRGLLGTALPSAPGPVDIYVHRGAGAYICGEETALLSSLNGWRGQPTAKPPFPAISGLFHCPTIVNNVETLACVPFIIREGAETFARLGTATQGGTRLFSVCGHVERPGLYEAPVGVTLRELIEGHAGGVRDGHTLKAVVPGGISAKVLTASEIDVHMDFDSLMTAGSMAGSGGVIVLDDTTCMLDALQAAAKFFAHESCGQCSPCREGTGWIHRILGRIAEGKGRPQDLEDLLAIARDMEGKTICVFADAAAWPVQSYITKFRDEFDAHVRTGACPVRRREVA